MRSSRVRWRARWCATGTAVVVSAWLVGLAFGGVAAVALGALGMVVAAVTLAVRPVLRRRTAPRPDAAGLSPSLASPVAEEVRRGAPLGAEALTGPVRLLDDRELCAAWRHSNEVLGYTRLPELRAQLVALRQAYLDEMERRHPAAFSAWLEGGATGDPEAVLVPRRTRGVE